MVALATAALAAAAPAAAGTAAVDLLSNPFQVTLGTFVVDTDTRVELDGQAGTGTVVNLERTFGDDDATRVRLDVAWRFAERHKLRAMAFDARADRSRTIDREIEWGEEVYPVGTEVKLDREFHVYELAYEYAFLRRDSWEVGASAGLHWTSVSFDLSARLEVAGQPGTTRSASQEASLDLPLPVFGLRGLWNPAGDFWLDGAAQLFSLSYDAYDGHLYDFRLAVLWQPKKWLGIGLGYNAFRVNLDVDKQRFRGSLEWKYGGPQLFLGGSF